MRSDGRGAAQLSKTRTNVQNSSTDGSRLWRLRLRIPVHVGPGATGLECAHALKLPSSNTDIAPARCYEASSRARCGDFIALHCVSPGHAAFGDQCSWATLRVGSEAACQSEAFRRQDTSAAKSWRTIRALRTRPPPSLVRFSSVTPGWSAAHSTADPHGQCGEDRSLTHTRQLCRGSCYQSNQDAAETEKRR
jgi:hypothetical protein